MKQCRPEGELRAYLDRELPPEDVGRVTAHVAECGACAAAVEGMAARAERVSALMGDLQWDERKGATGGSRADEGVRPTLDWRWIAAAAALAACLAMAYVAIPRRGRRPDRPVAAAPVAAVVAPAPAAPVQEVAQASRPLRRPRKRTPRPQPEVQYFLALDDEPFEVGVVERVALGPAEIPAEVVFSPDGRARAIRLVNYSGN
jgi:hypothetical protein